jgi:O-antigen/teichoic acid export membrane protein
VFHIPHSYRLAAQVILVVAGFNVAASLTGGVFGGILVALERFDLVNLLEVGSGVLRTSAVVVALLSGHGLITLAVIQLFFTAATGATYTWLSFYKYPQLRLKVAACDWQHVRMIFSFSLYLFVLTISNNLIFYTDSIVIGYFFPVGMITFFAIAGNLINYSRGVIRGVSTTATPRASALHAGGNEEGVRRVLLRGAQYATVIVLPIALTFMLRGTTFIRLWMGPEYAERSGHVLWILAVSLVFIAGELVAVSTMIGIGKHSSLTYIYCAEALCNLALSIALVRPMGIYGVAWGTTLPSLAVSLVFWPWYVRHTLGISVRTYLICTWLRPAFAAIPFVILTYIVERLWPAPNLFVFFLQTSAILPSIALPAWYLCFDPLDRRVYAHKFMQPVLRTIRS